MGLVTAVMPHGQLQIRARGLAEKIMRFVPRHPDVAGEASSQPPPSASPLMAAIVGRGKRSISAKRDEVIAASPSSRPRPLKSLMSAPETNAARRRR